MVNRFFQIILILSTLILSWLWMMIVHEFGHVVLAWSCGETISKVVLHPLTISRTDLTHERHPLLVIWGGPTVGVLIPLGCFLSSKLLRFRFDYLCRFFAGFCLIANGAYLGVGSFWNIGDAGDLIREGSPQVLLVAFGLVSAPLGLWLWNGLGPHFGLKQAAGKVDRASAAVMLALVAATVIAEVLIDAR